MNFKEDVFAKVITYITVAVLLGAMLVEAFVIYTERSEKKEIAGRLVSARASVSSLTKEKAELEAHNTELQEFKSKWENLVILADNEFCQDPKSRRRTAPWQRLLSPLLRIRNGSCH